MTSKKPAPSDIVDTLLNDLDMPSKRNVISDNADLAAAVRHFLDLKKANDPRVAGITLAWFYKNKLRDRFGGPRTMDTVRTYVREILKRDPSTGENYGE